LRPPPYLDDHHYSASPGRRRCGRQDRRPDQPLALTSSGRQRASQIGALIAVLEISDTDDELTRAQQHADGTNADGQGRDDLAG
jgi:hypothetical protein